MNTQATDETLARLQLHGMLEALEAQRRNPRAPELDFEERLAELVEHQRLWKEDRALAARLRYAGFRIRCALEEINYRHARGLKRDHIEQMRAARWVENGRNCLILGATGLGKSFLACALGHQACRDGHRTLYYYAPKLFRDLEQAQAEGTLNRLMKKLLGAALLVVDDIGIASVKPQRYREFLEILDDRQGKGSTLITSQVPVEQWHEMIPDATVADAILDRLVHHAYRLELKGDSLRRKYEG